MRTVAIVQCRMSSTRLPGKALMDLAGQPLIAHVLKRAAASKVDEVILATSADPSNDELVEVVTTLGFRCYRGSEGDVLHRMHMAAKWARADVVVRLTGDCPLLEPELIDDVIDALGNADMASNVLTRTYAKGLDTEVMHLDTLARIDRLATSPEAREHVTWFAYRRPDLFVLRSVERDWLDLSHLNHSVDTQEDLDHVRKLCAA